MILGPTAVGKSDLSISLAKDFGGEIINGDAMQFYKGLDIGTAKVSLDEQKEIKHHLLDILTLEEKFSVSLYQKMVRDKITEIKSKNKLPIIVGGSGLYLNAIIYDYKFLGNEREEITESKFEDLSLDELANILKNKSPKLASKTDLLNRRRVIRALEKSDDDLQENLNKYYHNALIIGLEMDRALLYQRINQRTDKMIKNGLIEEARNIYDKNIDSQAFQAIGYKELFKYFNNEISKDQAIDLIKRNSRRYAKRQMTWFKNKMEVNWFKVDPNDFLRTINDVKKIIKKEVE
jgi:tRNA dimethylallyltransferase